MKSPIFYATGVAVHFMAIFSLADSRRHRQRPAHNGLHGQKKGVEDAAS